MNGDYLGRKRDTRLEVKREVYFCSFLVLEGYFHYHLCSLLALVALQQLFQLLPIFVVDENRRNVRFITYIHTKLP